MDIEKFKKSLYHARMARQMYSAMRTVDKEDKALKKHLQNYDQWKKALENGYLTIDGYKAGQIVSMMEKCDTVKKLYDILAKKSVAPPQDDVSFNNVALAIDNKVASRIHNAIMRYNQRNEIQPIPDSSHVLKPSKKEQSSILGGKENIDKLIKGFEKKNNQAIASVKTQKGKSNEASNQTKIAELEKSLESKNNKKVTAKSKNKSQGQTM